MARILVCIVSVAILIYFVVTNMGESVSTTPKVAIDIAITDARGKNKMSSKQEALLRVQLAISDFVRKNGGPPTALGELVPTYFDSVPKDPDTNAPFEYSRTGSSYRLNPTVMTANAATKGSGSSSSASDKGQTGAQEAFQRQMDRLGAGAQISAVNAAYSYNPKGKRDPFLPFDLSPPKPAAGAAPLERYVLGQFRVTAIFKDLNGNLMANVEDPSGKGFNVRVGTKIGIEGGVVNSVGASSMNVLIRRVDITGKVTETASEMKIQPKPDADAKRPVRR